MWLTGFGQNLHTGIQHTDSLVPALWVESNNTEVSGLWSPPDLRRLAYLSAWPFRRSWPGRGWQYGPRWKLWPPGEPRRCKRRPWSGKRRRGSSTAPYRRTAMSPGSRLPCPQRPGVSWKDGAGGPGASNHSDAADRGTR